MGSKANSAAKGSRAAAAAPAEGAHSPAARYEMVSKLAIALANNPGKGKKLLAKEGSAVAAAVVASM